MLLKSRINQLVFDTPNPIEIITEEADPVEFENASGEFEYYGQTYPYWGNERGRAKTQDYEKGKFNRYAKLGTVANTVVEQLSELIQHRSQKIDGRCAYASLLMMKYGIRVGNEGSAEGYESGMEKNKGEIVQTFGTTTLLNEHISFPGQRMNLSFLGKEQVEHDIIVTEPFLVKYGKNFWDPRLPKNKWLGIEYDTLFSFVKQKIGDNFVPKDLRTFCANTTGWNVIQAYLGRPTHPKKSDAKKEIKEIVEKVAHRLGNTPGIAKKNYIDNRMLDWFLDKRWKPESKD